MYASSIVGPLTQLRGWLRERWGRLIQDRLVQVDGRWEQVSGVLQREYGLARDEVEQQLRALRQKYEAHAQPTVGCQSSPLTN